MPLVNTCFLPEGPGSNISEALLLVAVFIVWCLVADKRVIS